MKHIIINFRGGGKIKLPANILKSIDVPDDFTVNKEGEDSTNKRICIANGCYVDSLDKTINLEDQLADKKCYTSDDFNNNELVNNGEYTFLEEILNSYIHDEGLILFSTYNGIISDEFAYNDIAVVVELIPIGYKATTVDFQEEESGEIVVYGYSGQELNVGTEVYGDENGNTPAQDGTYDLYENVNIIVPNDTYAFRVENGQVLELFIIQEQEEDE